MIPQSPERTRCRGTAGRNMVTVNDICVNILPVEEMVLLNVPLKQQLGPCSVPPTLLLVGMTLGWHPFCWNIYTFLHLSACSNESFSTCSALMLQDDFILGNGAVSALTGQPVRQRQRRRRAARPSSVTFYKFLADCAAETQPRV